MKREWRRLDFVFSPSYKVHKFHMDFLALSSMLLVRNPYFPL